ncbi:FAD-dependent monooxygenase [Phanerochaete sordida]|uniref:FAD-dependent monooxygenase n=1 Tax=Phanerochaete sordida TaxID=48140 RepID=A0A9P3LGZ3_9APHY|nr:FAD-dependent monooxygenase [Phanerochaete sordida]
MSPVRVAVIGAGIAGPVAAMFLKQQGYDPVIFERNDGVTDAGLGIAIAGNGTRVLSQIPGLLEYIDGWEMEELHMYSVVPGDEGLLGTTDYFRRLRAKTGFGTFAVRRHDLHRRLVAFAQRMGVEVRWSHHLAALEQGADGVAMQFANGEVDSASFVVGCDGLHSNTRVCLFGDQPADYTGISQWGGIGLMPDAFRGKKAAVDFYGDGAAMVIVPVDETHGFWGLSVREPESKETWRATDTLTMEDFKKSHFRQWGFGAGQAVQDCMKLTRYGLYDRPELATWHKGRVLVIGDAAHPSSPNHGQGANQAFEDIDLLISLLAAHNPTAVPPSTAMLESVFRELEAARIPRTAELARGARKQGETRVAAGPEACRARNAFYREMCADEMKQKARFGV